MSNKILFVVLENNDKSERIEKFVLTRDTQKEINEHFEKLWSQYMKDEVEAIEFDGRYKPDENEVLMIKNYKLETDILEAVKSPNSVEIFTPSKKNMDKIKHFFMSVEGSDPAIIFQKATNTQMITTHGVSMFHKNGTFQKAPQFGINISDKLDCIYSGKSLYFRSYFMARQIFDLKDHYKTATEYEVKSFACSSSISVQCTDTFYSNSDQFVRRKIALINDSKVLVHNTANDIVLKAMQYDLDIPIVKENGVEKLVLPNDKKELKQVLKFLDEDIYKGTFTEKIFETNSKRERY